MSKPQVSSPETFQLSNVRGLQTIEYAYAFSNDILLLAQVRTHKQKDNWGLLQKILHENGIK